MNGLRELDRYPRTETKHGVETTTDIFKIHRRPDGDDRIEVQVHDKTCMCPNGNIECAAYRAFYWYEHNRTIKSDDCICEPDD